MTLTTVVTVVTVVSQKKIHQKTNYYCFLFSHTKNINKVTLLTVAKGVTVVTFIQKKV